MSNNKFIELSNNSTDETNLYSESDTFEEYKKDMHNEKKYKPMKNINILKKKTHKNVKRMLCQNVLKDGICSYGSKCMYAHKLEEQNIDPTRKQAWSIILSEDRLDDIDLHKNYQLYQSLDQFTKICKQCEKNECIGGYNCDHGVFSQKYQICQSDINYGECKNDQCKLIHLTKRGLKPWFKNVININPQSATKIKGTLLNENFFHKNEKNEEETLSNFTDSSEEIEDIENGCYKSIFEK